MKRWVFILCLSWQISFAVTKIENTCQVIFERFTYHRAPVAMENFENSEKFRSYLKHRQIVGYDTLAEPKKEAVRLAYLKEELSRMSENLSFLQERSLATELGMRGVTKTQSDGYQMLKELSKNNRARLEVPISSENPDKQAQKAVEALSFEFIHNTVNGVDTIRETSHLVSSKQLANMGLSAGVNTGSFNQELMASNNNVFFYAIPRIKKGFRLFHSSQYGSEEILLKENYAKDRGWISAFVMYPGELISTTYYTNPKLYERVLEVLKKENREDLRRSQNAHDASHENYSPEIVGLAMQTNGIFCEKHPDLANEMRQSLSVLDFTVSDFEALVKNQILVELSKIKKQDIKQYNSWMSKLKNPNEVRDAVRQLAYKPLNFPRRFELKVPVAIPTSEVR